MTAPSAAAIEAAARALGCEVEALMAVIDVEASGRWLDDQGKPIVRFEPHKFHMRRALGWTDGWRDYLSTGAKARAAMYERAAKISREEANRACSWGGPQIMGFNHGDAGYPSATSMAEAFRDPDAQLKAFARMIEAWGLADAVASRDWLAFARRWNGNGQPEVYAARMEAAWRRRTGAASPVVLRMGARGEAVTEAQQALARAGFLPAAAVDGIYGPGTKRAVEAFQKGRGLAVDGILGRETWAALRRHVGSEAAVPVQPSTTGRVADTVQKGAQWIAAGGAATIGTVREEARALAADLGLTLPEMLAIGAAAVAAAWVIGRIVALRDRRVAWAS